MFWKSPQGYLKRYYAKMEYKYCLTNGDETKDDNVKKRNLKESLDQIKIWILLQNAMNAESFEARLSFKFFCYITIVKFYI